MCSFKHKKLFLLVLAALLALTFSSCSKNIGWGVLLWFIEDPALPSGTVVPVRVRSNIEQAWIIGVPEEYRVSEDQLAMVPLPHLELFNSKRAAEKYAESFSGLAFSYAETMQDGLPIREKPENSARRMYRLKEGEIVKLLEKSEGVEAIGASGSALEGDWYRVLTNTGSTGYCFSLRLRIFEHSTGEPLGDKPVEIDTSRDSELELVLSRTWYPESYKTMIDSGRLDIDYLSRSYSFNSGIANGKARVRLEEDDLEFPYQKIVKTGERAWNFDNTSLNVILRSETSLEVHWEDDDKTKRSETFVTLSESVENVVNREKERRQNLFQTLYVRGPGFVSANYGILTLSENGNFTWDDAVTLPPELFAGPIIGSGVIDVDYTLTGEMANLYSGALALRFNSAGGSRSTLVFAYTLDYQGLRMEHIPSELVSGRTVGRRTSEPLVIYFSTEN